MANPYRGIANSPKNWSDHRAFASRVDAVQFAEEKRKEGFNARETKYRIGPRGSFNWMYRVSWYEKKVSV